MRLHWHQHGEKPALFVAEISGNSTTAFSLPRWRAGWWNNTLRFSGNSLQISLCEARDSPLSTGTQSSGLGWCRQQLPRWQLCTCQIILQPVDPGACLCSPFPDSRQVLSSSAATEAKIFFFFSSVVFVCYLCCECPQPIYPSRWGTALSFPLNPQSKLLNSCGNNSVSTTGRAEVYLRSSWRITQPRGVSARMPYRQHRYSESSWVQEG